MTSAQTRYFEMQESKRHNRAAETIDWNKAQLQAETSRYTAETSAAATRYSADTSAAASRYTADQRYAGTVTAAQINADTSRRNAEINASTQRYVSDQNAATAKARLEFDRETQVFTNAIKEREVQIENLKANTNERYVIGQVQKMANDTAIATQKLAQEAERLGLETEATYWQNKLNRAREFETWSKTILNYETGVEKAGKILHDLLNIVHGGNYDAS